MDPITREEQYLNAILTGNKSNLPAPITREEQYLYAIAMKGGGGGTDDYEELENLPKINNNVLKGNQTAAELGLASRSSISNVLRDGGMIDCADLVADLLVAANYGKVYITSDTGTTTSSFVDGAGVSISAGDSVEITNVGTTESPVYKFKLNMARGGSSNTFNEDDFDVVSNEVSLKPARRTFVGTRLEWEALSSEQKALYEMVALTDDEDADYKDVYSTSEVKTNKVWIDGKPIYQRTINCGALSEGTHNIETLTVEEVKFIKGFMYSDVSNIRPLPFPADSTNAVRVDVTDNVLRIITYSSWIGYSAYLTIQYTKTTD